MALVTAPNPSFAREVQTQDLLVQHARTSSDQERDGLCAEIVTLNLGLCETIVRRYLNRGAERDDLAQVARLALLLAVRRFDPFAGSRFAAFAIPTILGEIKRHFRDHCWMVRPPRPLLELRARARTCRNQFEQTRGRAPTEVELSLALGVEESELREALQIDGSYRPWSLDPPDASGERQYGTTEFAVADPVDTVERLIDGLTLRRMIATMTMRDQKIVKWRFVEGLTQQQIAERIGLSQMQVSRILKRILDGLREQLEPGDAHLEPERFTA